MAALKKQGGCNYCNGSQGSLAHRDSKMANKAQCVPRRNIDGQPTRVLLKCIIKRSRIHESRRKHGKSRFLAHFQVYNSTGLDTVCSPLNVTLQPSAPSSVPREDWTMRTESVSSLVLWLEFGFNQCKATIGEWRERVRGEGIYSPGILSAGWTWTGCGLQSKITVLLKVVPPHNCLFSGPIHHPPSQVPVIILSPFP